MEFTGKISKKIHIFKNVLTTQVRFCIHVRFYKETPFVEGHFGNCRFKIEGCIPGTALRPIKASTKRTRMAESCVDDLGLRDTKEQFIRADPHTAPMFSNFALVCSSIELTEIRENIARQWQSFENASCAVFTRDKPVCRRFLNLLDMGQLTAAPSCV